MKKRQTTLIAFASIALLLVAAAPLAARGVEEVEEAVAIAEGESPMLASLVEAGELPPVEERLPNNPLVLEPPETIGRYGGTLEIATTGTPGGPGDFMALLRAEADIMTISPNIAESYELSDDATVLTLRLREGLKWSDGHPFTADDILFAWYDFQSHPDLNPAGLGGWQRDLEIERVDDYTVRYVSPQPEPHLPRELARDWGVQARMFLPKHFVSQFHLDHGDADEIEQWVRDSEEADTWYELEIWDADWHNYTSVRTPDGEFMPTLDPFILTELTTEYAVHTRNPYYWAVDPEGNQLPYVDEVLLRHVTDSEVLQGQIISGEIDYAEGSFANFPLYMDYADREGFRVLLYEDLRGSFIAFQINQTYDGNEYLAELFRDPKFRQAMSLAIDRDEINEIVFLGQAEPRQASLTPASRFYREEYTQAYAEYDPERANRKLDELGLTNRDGEGYRLLPDGSRLRIEHVTGFDAPEMISIFELSNEYWSEVGIQVDLEIRGSERFAWAADNEIQMWSWLLDKMTDVFMPYHVQGMGFFVPVLWSSGWNVEGVWGTEWARYYRSDGAEGQAPPPEYQELVDMFEEIRTTTDETRLEELVHRIMSFQAENLVQIGTVGLTPTPIIARDRLRNVREEGYTGWDAFFAYPYRRELWFIDQ